VKFRKLEIEGNWEIELENHFDERGNFRETYSSETLRNETGIEFKPVQENFSTSSKGALRGIHFSIAPEGQSKWITCSRGSILDCIVDLRINSPSFGRHVLIKLDSVNPKALLVAKGMGHAFLALEESTEVHYLLSSAYQPKFEFAINPLDPNMKIVWPEMKYILSQKDNLAPTLDLYVKSGNFPSLPHTPNKS
jgi:dTDP-4-dehydrorhamnose 3,5-epimerase